MATASFCGTCASRLTVELAAMVFLVAGLPALGDEDAAIQTYSDTVPRYRFQVGQELVYRVTHTEDLLAEEEEKADDKPKRPDPESGWRVYVARENDDGSWRLFVRRMQKMYSLTEDGKPKVKFENDFLGYVDLRPDGTYEVNESMGDSPIFQLQPNELFFQLHHDLEAVKSGWEYDDPASNAHYDCAPAAPVDGLAVFTAKSTTPEDANYESTETYKFYFDIDRGLLVRRDRESKATWSVNPWHSRGTKELVEEKQHDATWMTEFIAAAENYLADDRGWWEAFDECKRSRSPSQCEELLGDIEAHLQQRLDSATIPEFKELYAARLALHERESRWAIDEAKEREELYARDPVDWETTDFDDNAHRLVDYRGKVVVMDFWYRGCGHCIEALPKIKQIAARYAARPVVVLGVNNDQVEADARHVMETFELKYPTICNGEISQSYGVSTWPTLIVIDQSGRVALFHSGNSENLVDEISRTVDELLARPAQTDAVVDSPEMP